MTAPPPPGFADVPNEELAERPVADTENDYFGFTQFQIDGSRLSSSNMYSDVFMDGGGNRGCLEEYAADGSLSWRLRLATDDYIHHHDAVKLPNGNVLALVWENVSTTQAIALGRNPEHVAENGNTLVNHGAKARVREVTPAGDIVWEYAYDDGAQGPHMLFRANRYPADHPAVTAIINGDIQ